MYTKKIVIVFCLCIFSITSLLAQSALDQQSGGAPAPKKTNEKKSDDKQKMNIVKVNLMALGLKNYSFQYERVLSKHVSVALGVRTMPMNGLPLKSTIIDIVGEDDPQITQTINDLKVGNFAITPEVRFYLSKKGYGRGFYVAPYYRYATFKAEQVSIEYESGPSSTNTIKLNGDVASHSGGLMFGAQWFIGKAVTIDWWILGAHYGKSNGNLNGVPSTPLTADEQQDIRDELNAIDLPVGKITSEVSANNVKAIFDGPWGGVRAGLTIGIRF